jgi:hypothetical protein
MKMNKYLGALLLFGFILINEAGPFLYNEAYTIKDMKWSWVILFPIAYIIYYSYKEKKSKE